MSSEEKEVGINGRRVRYIATIIPLSNQNASPGTFDMLSILSLALPSFQRLNAEITHEEERQRIWATKEIIDQTLEQAVSEDIQKHSQGDGWQGNLTDDFVEYLKTFVDGSRLNPESKESIESNKICAITQEKPLIPIQIDDNTVQYFDWLAIRKMFIVSNNKDDRDKLYINHPTVQGKKVYPQQIFKSAQAAANLKKIKSLDSFNQLIVDSQQTSPEKQKIYKFFIQEIEELAKKGEWGQIYDMTKKNYELADDENGIREVEGASNRINLKAAILGE